MVCGLSVPEGVIQGINHLVGVQKVHVSYTSQDLGTHILILVPGSILPCMHDAYSLISWSVFELFFTVY